MRTLLNQYALLTLGLWLVSCSHAVLADSVLRIGVLAYEGRETARQRWQPTADYLAQQLPNERFVIEPLNHQEFEHAINQGQLDFVLTNPAHFASLNVNFGISRIATFIANPRNQPQARFSAVLFTRADSTVKTLNDLRGRRLAAVSENAFGGYQLARDLLLRHGLDTQSDLQVQWFGFPHSAVVDAVLAGKADAGTVRSGVLEAMADHGELSMQQLKILVPRTDDGYPFAHSMALFPEWPFARLPKTSTKLSRKVALALMSMPANSRAARMAHGFGWTIPLSDARVHTVLKRLQLSPYQPRPLSPAQVWDQYAGWISVVAALLLTTFAALWRLSRTNHNLQQTQNALQVSQGELEIAVRERARELDRTREALDDSREHSAHIEHDNHNACDALSALYELLLREDLQAEQRMAAMVEAIRHQMKADIGVLSRRHNTQFVAECLCPVGSEQADQITSPLVAEEAEQALQKRQLHHACNARAWARYLAYPVYLEGNLHFLLEFATAQAHDEDDKLPSPLAVNLLHLVAQWISHEIRREELQRCEHQRLQALRQRFADVTPRETDVLLQLVRGQSNKEIARHLSLSPKTVEMHRANLLRKTHARSSTELVQLAVSAKWPNAHDTTP